MRAHVTDITRPFEVDILKQEGVLTSIKDLNKLFEDGTRMLRHMCNEQCKMAVGNGVYRCCKLNNAKNPTDNKKQ